jgi:beta-phosphoglucomutase-like phosphatase (HAD superfamily)
MDPLTLRLEDETIEDLSTEYEERGFRNRAVYIRWIIGQRDRLFEEDDAEIDAAGRLADHAEQLSEHDDQLETHDERLEALEEQARPFSWTSRSSDSSP